LLAQAGEQHELIGGDAIIGEVEIGRPMHGKVGGA
jgi:hypothetical protein